MSELLRIENVHVTDHNDTILDHVSLSVHEHEFITIVGPNGAGKSTLIKILANVLTPTSGKVWRKPSINIGYIPQRFHCDPLLPIDTRYFLSLNLPKTQKGNKNKSEDQSLVQAVEQVGLDKHLLNKPLSALSGGEMQRVLLCRALLQKPDLLIMDEPTQSLDVRGQLEFYQLIESLHLQKTCSIVMVSHDLHIVMASTNKVICLYKHICCSGEGNLIVKEQAFIDIFGPELADKIAIYPHQHNHHHH
ncbi:MAG: metal ABC transporter ATP-binding protein [Pseudomonadota bacterium]|nr:metal ABC transporter ATP-binding protein [Pseudomonadota bacterium]